MWHRASTARWSHFFQACSPVPLRQLSTDCALAAVAKAAEANTIATLMNFFMVLLMGIKYRRHPAKKRYELNDHHPKTFEIIVP
jgi:hypothetical protein